MSKPLRDFVLGEVQNRQLSLRQFADVVGVSYSTLSKLINSPESGISFELLTKLASATKTDIGILARLAAPHVAVGNVDVDSLASRINRLPPEKRRVVDVILTGVIFQHQNNESDKG